MNNVTYAIDAYFRDLEPLLNRPLLAFLQSGCGYA